MKRFCLEYISRGYDGDSELVPYADGDLVSYNDAVAHARRAQRAVIAALFWRAGYLAIHAELPGLRHCAADARAHAASTANAARAAMLTLRDMEATHV